MHFNITHPQIFISAVAFLGSLHLKLHFYPTTGGGQFVFCQGLWFMVRLHAGGGLIAPKKGG